MKTIVIRWALLVLVSLALLVIFSGCNTETIVANDRTQEQAVELVTLLNSHGISAGSEQRRGSQNRFNINVPTRYYNQAIALVHRYGLAGDAEPSFNDLLSSGSFLPASRAVESFKLDLALAMLVEQSLRTLSAVHDVKVVIRQNFSEAGTTPSGSVVVLLKPQATLTEDTVREVIQATLPEINPENMVIKLSEGRNVSSQLIVQAVDNQNDTLVSLPLRDFVYWKVPDGEFNGLAWFFMLIMLLTALIFAGIGFLLAYIRYNRAVIDPQFGEPGLLGMATTDRVGQKKIAKEN